MKTQHYKYQQIDNILEFWQHISAVKSHHQGKIEQFIGTMKVYSWPKFLVMSTSLHTQVNIRLYIQLTQHTKNGILLFYIWTHNLPELPKKHTYMIPCPYIQRRQPEDMLTISYPILHWTYMEVWETKKIFLIFLISAYVNLGARFLYTIQTLE